MDRTFGFVSPRKHGHTVVEAIAAMERGEAKVFIGLGAISRWPRLTHTGRSAPCPSWT